MGISEQDIKDCCEGAIVEKGLAIRGSNVGEADKEIENWLKNLNKI